MTNSDPELKNMGLFVGMKDRDFKKSTQAPNLNTVDISREVPVQNELFTWAGKT